MLLGSSKLLRSGVGGAAGGSLPPDNDFGLMSLTTTRSGTFQASTVTKSGAPLRWWWGDGTYTDGNNPVKTYPDSSEKTIYIATSDGWLGLTNFYCLSMSITSVSVSVAAAITQLYLGGNNLTIPPDVSNNTSLTRFYLNSNNLTVSPDVSSTTSLTRFYLNDNNLDAAELAAVIDDCYTNRVALGGNACLIRIQSNAQLPNADTVAKIEGTGIYAGDGLKDNGCLVEY